MLDILSIIPGKKRRTANGWYSFNAVCCANRGHNADRRSRGGVAFTDNTNWIYHCFNCQFKCGFQLGQQLTKNTRLLLSWCGLDEQAINKISFESFSQRDITQLKRNRQNNYDIQFESRQLPEFTIRLDEYRSDHEHHIKWLQNRGLQSSDYEFYVTENESRTGIIIPYYYQGMLVGHTTRFYDDRKPKYISDRQSGYVFNLDNQKSEWTNCILVEGEFDAISVGGCAYMGSIINDNQAQLLNRLQRNIIVVPDRDKTGLEICDRALELGYKVSIPDWADDVKDVNDAVIKYGRLSTLLSILRTATSSKIKVEMTRKKFK